MQTALLIRNQQIRLSQFNDSPKLPAQFLVSHLWRKVISNKYKVNNGSLKFKYFGLHTSHFALGKFFLKTAHQPPFFLLVFAIFPFLSSACTGRPLLNIAGINGPAPYEPPAQAETHQIIFDTVWNDVNDHYLHQDFDGVDWEQINQTYLERLEPQLSQSEFHQLLEEMVAEIPSSGIELITREERIDRSVRQTQGFSSVGPFVAVRDSPNEEPRLIVLHVVPGSPAAKAGLRPHDAILGIDGKSIESGAGDEAIKQLQGANGSNIQLIVRSPQQEPRIVTLVRQQFRSEPVDLQSLTVPGTSILYVVFPPHEDRNILNEFSTVLDQIPRLNSGSRGLIIDMRLMTGVHRSVIFQLLPLFVDGEIAIRSNSEEQNPISINGVPSPLQNASQIPIVLMTSPETAGPAELFAAALQDQGRATIIGQKTAGTLQEVEARFLQDGSQLILPTSTLIMTNSQRDIGRFGIEPDILIDANWDEFTSENDPAVAQAIRTIRNAWEADQ